MPQYAQPIKTPACCPLVVFPLLLLLLWTMVLDPEWYYGTYINSQTSCMEEEREPATRFNSSPRRAFSRGASLRELQYIAYSQLVTLERAKRKHPGRHPLGQYRAPSVFCSSPLQLVSICLFPRQDGREGGGSSTGFKPGLPCAWTCKTQTRHAGGTSWILARLHLQVTALLPLLRTGDGSCGSGGVTENRRFATIRNGSSHGLALTCAIFGLLASGLTGVNWTMVAMGWPRARRAKGGVC